MIRRPATRTALAVALAATAVGIFAPAALAEGGGCASGAGWTLVTGVPAGTSSVTVAAPEGTGIVETCVWTGTERELNAYDPAASSVVIAPLAAPTIVDYAYRVVTVEQAPAPEPAPTTEPTATPTPAPEPAAAPAPATAPAPQPAVVAPARQAPSASRAVAPTATVAATSSSATAPVATESAQQESAAVAPDAVADDDCVPGTSRSTCAPVTVLGDVTVAPTTTMGPSASVRGSSPLAEDLGASSGARTAASIGALVLLAGGGAVLLARYRTESAVHA